MPRILAALLFAAAPAAVAQEIVSAQSGTIHYHEGKVLLAGQELRTKPGEFAQVKEKALLETEEGRAEVLLTPGVFLRVGENSSMRMLSNRLIDTRIELVSGKAVLEMADASLMDAPKSAPITVVINGATVTVRKKGLYSLAADEIKVYDGELEVAWGDRVIDLKEGRVLPLDGALNVAKFDTKNGDSLLRWTRRRAEYMSLASISAAKSARDFGGSWSSSRWLWNPYYGMFTFIPARGIYTSPFGYQFWSPYTVYRIYRPRPVIYNSGWAGAPGWSGRGGYATMPRSSGGYSGSAASAPVSAGAPSTSAAGAGAAPISRGGAGGGGGGRSGAGRTR
jgi:hypothetical protein